MSKVLVTGGAGFIGSHVVEGYLEEGWEVVVIDNLSQGKVENINPRANFYKISLLDKKLSQIFKKEKFDLVNHHAAHINVRISVKKPLLDLRQNVAGTLNLLQNCVRFGVKNFIFISSGGAIYGEHLRLPVKENYSKRPISPYGIDKLTAEFYLFFYKKTFGLNYLSLRYANIYGPRQDPYGEAGVVAIFSNKMLRKERPAIFGDGTQTRDYVFVKDVVKANLLASYKIEKLNLQNISSIDDLAYNIGTGREESVNSLYEKLSTITGFNFPPQFLPPRQGEIKRISLSPEKTEKQIGWKPETSLEKGLEKTVQWIKNQSKHS